MKKGLIIGLAALFAIFGMTMMSCGDGGGGGGGDTPLPGSVSIIPTENVEVGDIVLATYTGTVANVTYQWKINGSNTGSASANNTFETTRAGELSVSVSADGYTPITSNAVTVTAYPPHYKLKKRLNFDGAPAAEIVRIPYGLITQNGEPKPIEASALAAPTVTPPAGNEFTWEFDGWYTSRWLGHGEKVEAGRQISENTSIYARWNRKWSDDILDLTDGAARVYLENAGSVIYKFTLDASKTWADVNNVKANYMIDETYWDWVEATTPEIPQIRTVRLMGAYLETDFTKPALYPDWDNKKSAKYAASGAKNVNKNSPYIYDNSADVGYSNDWTAINAEMPYKWFTVTYKVRDRESANNDWDPTNIPTGAGPFYFGIGIAGSGNSGAVRAPSLRHGIVSWIGNVELYDDSGAKIGSGALEADTFGAYHDPVIYQWSSTDNAAEPILTYPPAYREDHRDDEVALPPGPPGLVLFNLAAWLADNTELADPLEKAGAPDGAPTIAVSASGIAVTGRDAEWNGVDVIVSSLKLTPSAFKYTVVVEGTAAVGEKMRLVQSTGTSVIAGGDALEETTFHLEGTMPADWGTASIRIHGDGTTGDFTITKITITYDGLQ